MQIARTCAPLIAVLALTLPAAAVAQDTAAPSAAPAEPQAVEPQPAGPAAPAAQPAQSGPNEYSEGGVPTGSGEDEEPAPVEPSEPDEPTSNDNPAPTNSGSAPSGGSAPAEATDTSAAPTETGLPRTGSDSWLIALIGIVLLSAGVVVRRRGVAAPRA